MTDFFKALKDDLTDRRLLPLVGLVGVILLGALGYALLGGGSGSSSSSSTPLGASTGAGVPVTEAQTAVTGSLAETANGAKLQRDGASHDPFKPLPSATAAKVVVAPKPATSSGSSAPTSSGGSSSPSVTESKSSGSGSSGSGSSAPSKPAAPAKPQQIYTVAIQFGPKPEAGAQNTQLEAYAGLKKATPLPSASNKLIEYVGVTANSGSRSATFALIGEAILHGQAACHPSQTQCQLITLKEGNTELMEFLTASGQTVTYELHVVSIDSVRASSASVKSVLSAQAKLASGQLAGGAVLSAAGMHFSNQPGVIVFAGHRAFGARASAHRYGH